MYISKEKSAVYFKRQYKSYKINFVLIEKIIIHSNDVKQAQLASPWHIKVELIKQLREQLK